MTRVASLTPPFADVNVIKQEDGSVEVVVCFVPDPDKIAGENETRAALAIDASRSIKDWFGTPGMFGKPDLISPVIKKLGNILCGITKKEDLSVFYWALGKGDDVEDLGTLTSEQFGKLETPGPSKGNWGKGTQILPAVKRIFENIGGDCPWVMGVIITDGKIEDETECIEYCMDVGRWLKNNPEITRKLVLIGVGDEVDEKQLDRLDDMFEETELKDDDIDLWACKAVAKIESEQQIIDVLFGELMGNIEIASSGKVLDSSGNVVQTFSDGLMGKFRFTLPAGCKSFTLQAGGNEIEQDISSAL